MGFYEYGIISLGNDLIRQTHIFPVLQTSGWKQLKRGSSQFNACRKQNLPGCDCSKSFLASSVPNLQLDGFAVQFNGSNLEVDTNGADVALGVSVVRKPQQKARFTNTGVTDQKQLEQIITEKKRKICILTHERNRGKFVKLCLHSS